MLIQEKDYTRHPGTKRDHLEKCVRVRTETINSDRQPKFGDKNKFNKKQKAKNRKGGRNRFEKRVEGQKNWNNLIRDAKA